jgi:hypothetical protein
MNYEESEWCLEPRQARTRVAKKEPTPAAEPEPIVAHCPSCGHDGPAKCSECGHVGVVEPVEPAPECMLGAEDVSPKHAPECMLPPPGKKGPHALECMLQEPVSRVSSDLQPQRDLLVKYLTEKLAPVYHVPPVEADLVAIEKRLGGAPVHFFAARCEARWAYILKSGKSYRGVLLGIADDARLQFEQIRNHNVRSIDKGKAEPMSDVAAAEEFAAKLPDVEEARYWFARQDSGEEFRAAIVRKFPELGKGAS